MLDKMEAETVGVILSVIVIAHNEERFIRECLDSITMQWRETIELIVIDDFSTDRTPDILSARTKVDQTLQVIRNAGRLGAGLSRNNGINKASGRYLMFVDADDTLVEGSLKKILIQLSEEEPDILVFNHNLIYDDGLSLEAKQSGILKKALVSKGDEQKTCLLKLYQIACNKVYKSSFIKQQHLYFTTGNYEDTAYAYKSLLLAGKISVSTLAYYNYRQRPGTAPYRPNKKENRVNQHFLVTRYTEIFNFLEEQNLQQFNSPIYNKMLIQFNAVIGERYDKKDRVLFKNMQDALVQYKPEQIEWPTFRSRIAYWCMRTGMVGVLVGINQLFSLYRDYQYGSEA